MPITIGVLRNNLWSLRMNANTHILFASMEGIDVAALERRNPEDFWIGCVHVKHVHGNKWILDFPGVYLGDRWLACEKGMPQHVVIIIERDDMDMLVEFVVHMKTHGQLDE